MRSESGRKPVALPELVKAGVKRDLSACRERRMPPHARHQVRMGFSMRGHHGTLLEERAPYDGEGSWMRIPSAQLRWDPDRALWGLFACDRNRAWFACRCAEPAARLGSLLGALDADRACIFWG